MGIIFGILLALVLTCWGLQLAQAKALFRHCYIQGKRAGLKEAVEIAKERGDVAALCAPAGSLTVGLVRAQAVHNVELDLRAALSEVR